MFIVEFPWMLYQDVPKGGSASDTLLRWNGWLEWRAVDNFCCSVLRGRDNEFVSPEATHKLAKLSLPLSDYVTTPHEYILSKHPAERHFPLMELWRVGGTNR